MLVSEAQKEEKKKQNRKLKMKKSSSRVRVSLLHKFNDMCTSSTYIYVQSYARPLLHVFGELKRFFSLILTQLTIMRLDV